MRIAIVAGFISTVNKSVAERFMGQATERSLIVHNQRKVGQVDLARLKSDIFDQLSQGATDFLVCVPEIRGNSHLNYSIVSLIDSVKARHSEVMITQASFKSFYDTAGLIAKIEDFQPSREMMFSGSLQDLEGWTGEKHAGRLILHTRAIRGLRKSRYQDVPGLYAAIDILAREYRETKLAQPHQAAARRRELDLRLLKCGLQISPSISETRAGEEGADYYVDFPPSGGNKFLDQHLKKGVAHDERVCLRIYFFWYAPSEQVVIGWLTSHLGTRDG